MERRHLFRASGSGRLAHERGSQSREQSKRRRFGVVAERGAWDPDEIKIDLCCGVVPGSLAWQPSHGRSWTGHDKDLHLLSLSS